MKKTDFLDIPIRYAALREASEYVHLHLEQAMLSINFVHQIREISFQLLEEHASVKGFHADLS